jgi:putative membrane protein
MWYGMWSWGPGWGSLFGVMHLLFWGLLLAAAVTLVRSGRGGWTGSPGRDRSYDILRERYARGEIDQRDFDERMQRLKSGAADEN